LAGAPPRLFTLLRRERLASKLKAVIFDWDLTLWNSWDIHVWLMGKTADDLGLPRPQKDQIAREYSRPFLQHLAWFFGDDQSLFLDSYIGFYREAVGNMSGLYPGVAETLRVLKRHGLKLGIFSDKRQPFGVTELELTGIGHLFDLASFLEDGRPYKPDPQGLKHAMDVMEVSPLETLYVGDTRHDIECAQRAGTRSAAALWGTVDREGLLAQDPDYSWDRAESILTSLGIDGQQAGGRS